MENRDEQILAEIRTMVSAVRLQLDRLESKIAELHHEPEPDDNPENPIDLDIDDDIVVGHRQEDLVPDVLVPETSSASESFPGHMPDKHEVFAERIAEETCDVHDEESPVSSEQSPIYEAAQSSPDKPKAVIDVMAEKQAWRTDIPGTVVRDIRSAISLNDRIIFINLLFKTDPMAFQDALTRINAMDTLEQVLEYIADEHPDWDLDSDLVYRFMMAVRRKIK